MLKSMSELGQNKDKEDEPDDIKGILNNDDEFSDTRRRCLIK